MGGRSEGEQKAADILFDDSRFQPYEFNKRAFYQTLERDKYLRQTRGQQQQLAGQLLQRARGEGPSVAQMQLYEGGDRLVAQQQAARAGLRGRGGALALREGIRQQAAQNQDLSRQAAQLRAQEQTAAQSLASQFLTQFQQQNIGIAESDRASKQRLEILRANEAARNQATQMQRAGASMQVPDGKGFFGVLGDVASAAGGVASTIAGSDENNKKNITKPSDANNALAKVGQALSSGVGVGAGSGDAIKQAMQGNAMSRGGGIAGAIGAASKQIQADQDAERIRRALAAQKAVTGSSMPDVSEGADIPMIASDETVKVEIKPESKPTSFLDHLTAYEYEYKDPGAPGAGDGRHMGVMAQDLEKSEVGKRMVQDTPAGKMVDMGKGFGAMLAAQAEMNDRIKKLERKKALKKK